MRTKQFLAPQMPSNSILEPVKGNITDDVGTTYICVGGRVGGTGTDWDATWIYNSYPPSEAETLTLEFIVSGTPTGLTCVVELQESIPDLVSPIIRTF